MFIPKKLLSTALLALMAVGVNAAPTEVDLNTKEVKAGGTPVGDLIRIPLERVEVAENVFYVSGLANVFMVNTPKGAIVIDTGFAHQAPGQMALLKEVLTGPVKYIFLPQGNTMTWVVFP